MTPVIIGMDPHKWSATIEIIDGREHVLHTGRFGTDQDGYHRMLTTGRRHTQRLWAVESCQGIGRHFAQRVVADGETVVDVPAKLGAGAGVRHRPVTGCGRWKAVMASAGTSPTAWSTTARPCAVSARTALRTPD